MFGDRIHQLLSGANDAADCKNVKADNRAGHWNPDFELLHRGAIFFADLYRSRSNLVQRSPISFRPNL